MSTVRVLRSHGHEVVHLSDEHLERLLDPAILEKASQEERLVLTFDLDFGELLATGVHALPSVIRGLLTGGVYKRPSTSETLRTTIMAERGGPAAYGQFFGEASHPAAWWSEQRPGKAWLRC